MWEDLLFVEKGTGVEKGARLQGLGVVLFHHSWLRTSCSQDDDGPPVHTGQGYGARRVHAVGPHMGMEVWQCAA
jgi:hypothetical protein